MIRHMRHGSPPRLMALQSILSPNRRESLPTPSAGVRITAFPIDRRALANRSDLGLTEAQVRGAVRALESVGFLDRALPEKGSAYRAVGPAGELRRKPVLFRFGGEYAPLFAAANNRAAAARGGQGRARRQISPAPAPRPS